MPVTPVSPVHPPLVSLPAQVVPLSAPVQWLILGWRDLRQCGWLSLAQGALLAAFGLALMATAYQHFWLLAGAFSGFLVVAPVLATSLYAMSRAIEHGVKVRWQLLRDTWLSWQQSRFTESGGYWCLVRFGILLALAGPMDFLRNVVLADDSTLFALWLALGGVLAAPIFASSIVAMPLLLDRRTNLFQAVLTSWRVVLANPGPMALWASLIMLLVSIGFATGMLGLIVLIPLLGHASWHAYRSLVDASALPERPRG
jgi:uncharacterized membrane protein